MGTKEEFCKLMYLSFHEEGVYSAEEVVMMADEGDGIREMINELLLNTADQGVIQILDWCHGHPLLPEKFNSRNHIAVRGQNTVAHQVMSINFCS